LLILKNYPELAHKKLSFPLGDTFWVQSVSNKV